MIAIPSCRTIRLCSARFLPQSGGGSESNKLFKLFGACGEAEDAEEHYGVKHDVMNCFNDDGINAMRFIAIENAPHNPTPALPRLVRNYFKKFRRDSKTGKLIQES